MVGRGTPSVLPDTDSTAWSIRLAQTLKVDACARVQSARRFLSAHRQPDHGIASYVASAEKSSASAPNGWQRSHTCVTAAVAGVCGLEATCRAYLRSVQCDDGGWEAYWWDDREFTTGLAVDALLASGAASDLARVHRARQWARQRIGPDGAVDSNVDGKDSAFSTAWTMRILRGDPAGGSDDAARIALRWLLQHQRDDGSWAPSIHLRIPPRETIAPVRSPDNINLLDLEANFTTAGVLAALVRSRGSGSQQTESRTRPFQTISTCSTPILSSRAYRTSGRLPSSARAGLSASDGEWPRSLDHHPLSRSGGS